MDRDFRFSRLVSAVWGSRKRCFSMRIKLDKLTVKFDKWTVIAPSFDAQFHSNTLNQLSTTWWPLSRSWKSFREKGLRHQRQSVLKHLNWAAQVRAPSSKLTIWFPELAILSNFFPDRKLSLHPQNRGIQYLGHQQELSDKIYFLDTSCKKLSGSDLIFLS